MGKRFWLDRISDAWNNGYPVYYLNLMTKKAIRLDDKNFQKVSNDNQIWSDNKTSQVKRIAICKSNFWDD